MLFRAEFVLAIVAIALSFIAVASIPARRSQRWRDPVAALGCALAGLTPALFFPFVAGERAHGTALWEWSAVGGPTIQASYRFDGLAAAGLAIGALYGGAALIATTRVPSRSSLLRPALLLSAFILMACAVTDDLVAATVVLGALAANTIFVALLVSPAPAVARVTAYLAAGTQAFIVAGLLITRFGGASFRFGAIAPDSVTPGVVLAATIGGALFAGLYPFVPWGYRHEDSGERESLRGLLTMPAGFGATIVLIRLLGTTRIDLARLLLPGIVPTPLVALAVLVFVIALWRALRGRPRSRRRLVVAAVALGILGGYPWLHWSHLVLAACLLSVAYAAAVSLALPDHWPTTRYDVVLAGAWIGVATGTPTALAGALAILLGGALAALADAFWMPPHRAYIAMLSSTTAIVSGALAIGVGATETPDLPAAILALVAITSVIALELVHVGRRLEAAAAPPDLEVTATVVAFLSSTLIALLFAAPLLDALAGAFGRPLDHELASSAYTVAALAVVAAVLAVVAGAVRPLLPSSTPIAERLARVVAVADP
ncbi:MAG TPA: hypothetical protein VJQ09_04385, partial [Candidatus Limnocylindria bacterium]|nr:hypothetical protein [Candidatus Limnocylindria bacterium]